MPATSGCVRCGHPIPRALALLLVVLAGLLVLPMGNRAWAAPEPCVGGPVATQALKLPSGSPQPDLVISGACTMTVGNDYYYGAVNIIKGGSLTFVDPGTAGNINFWASSIIIENGGAMYAGVDAPFGAKGATLTITLYGADQSNGNPVVTPGQGALCVTKTDAATGPCGIPLKTWTDNGKTVINNLPGGAKPDYFYQYGPLYGDGKAGTNGPGYFGYKVLALSYGGTLQLRGAKGTKGAAAAEGTPSSSGTDWVRLAASLGPPADKAATQQTMTLDTDVSGDWQAGDQIVITSTDYIPTHSEQVTIKSVSGASVTFSPPVRFLHNGVRYPLKTKLGTASSRLGFDPVQVAAGAETRAAVALLNRSIRIVSGGDIAGRLFECTQPTDKCESSNYYFGGQVIFRQGFQKLQIQGVEFKQLGQGGRMMHYAVHFHEARNPPNVAPNDTYIKDSSVNESMTRWFVLHSTNGVTLARNVGYRSIGHGYYLEDGTETDNKLYSNIGIDARAAVYSDDNPRKVPGIFAANNQGSGDAFPQLSDVNHPTVFWITNGWNDYIGNMAVGAGTCGSCFWFIASKNNDFVDVGPMVMDPPNYNPTRMRWTGYSALQGRIGAGTTPLRTFYKNYCSSAMNSFITVAATASCNGMAAPSATPVTNRVTAIPSIAPNFDPGKAVSLMYYPTFTDLHFPTVCDPNAANDSSCSVVPQCDFANPTTCSVSVLDHYTSSFNWADFNFSALWLRSGWYLLDNSVISDVQNAGLTFVSGGDYLRSSVPEGYWAVASHVAFIGETQPKGAFTSAKGPFNNGFGGDTCVFLTDSCVNTSLGLPFQLSNFGTNQRLFNIYDGPTYEDSNAFLDIATSPCTAAGTCMYWQTPGVRLGPSGGFMPNAAIAWKQSNGFYYPPAFHSRNLFFNNVDIRHYVIEPFFKPGTYLTDTTTTQKNYTGTVPLDLFKNFTDVDRQTELNDDDGTLTGLIGTLAPLNQTISVNKDSFFNAPIETDQCKSNVSVNPANACSVPPPPPAQPRATAKTSPYDYVTTVVFPGCAVPGGPPGKCGSYTGPPPEQFTDQVVKVNGVDVTFRRWSAIEGQGGTWSAGCGGPYCFGVPLYRQFLLGDNNKATATEEWKQWYDGACDTAPSKCLFPFARMAGTGKYQRSVLTVNGGTYYLDTTVSQLTQRSSEALGLKADPNASYVECDFKPKGTCQPRSVNVFLAGQTYYVFFVYAKYNTKQVYQIYVGNGFDVNKGVKASRMTIQPTYETKEITIWPAGWKRELIAGPDGKLNVLQITVDMAGFKSELDPSIDTNGTCKPISFCKPSGSSCLCNLSASDPRVLANPKLMASCTQTCGNWGKKDLDCPASGCLGFAFTLPNAPNFVADDSYHRPTPTKFPTTDLLAAKFARTTKAPDSSTGGTCYYTKIPGTDCAVPFAP